ncbi:leucine-rich repeat domain-containing protein [Schaalia suimastitidis]|uniref:leucine-rich repeat domain-containing protein n=1 Tax=Schaalia suimastitidis TaxID=121163 RepID=UPI0013F3FAB0|nr:leucine-rich repeat domain-containing protein [Schaalia suimastitidis]
MSPITMCFRRIIGLGAVGILALTLLTPHQSATAAAANVTVDNIVYSIDEANPGSPATVVNYVRGKLARTITIPEHITHNSHQYPVTTISESAFQGAWLTSVTLPSSLTRIDTLAFKSNRLKEVTLPQGLTHIGESAFESNALTTVTLPDSVKTMGSAAFKNNLSLTSVTLSSGLAEIPSSTFINTKITTVDIPATVTKIGAAAFASSGLESLTIPASVATIGPSAFEANRIATLTLPEGMTAIPAGAFKNNLLTSLTLPSTVTDIGAKAFASNRITSVIIPQGVTKLPEQVFHSNNLTSITFPNTLATIGEEAFEYNNLSEITLPANVTEVGRGAFGSNYSLKTVRLEGSAPTIVEPSQWGGHKGSFGTYRDGLVIEYHQRYDATHVGEGGYTTPTWKRYTTVSRVPTHAQLQLTPVIDGGQAQPSDVAFAVTRVDTNEAVTDQAALLPGTYRLSARLSFASGGGAYESQGWTCQERQTSGVTKEIAPDGTLTVAAGDEITCTHRFRYVPAPPSPSLSVAVDQLKVATGSVMTFTASGFSADEEVTFTVHSDPVLAGKAAADARGVAVLRWTVPTDFPTGEHRVQAAGRVGSAQTAFTVTAANNANNTGGNGNKGSSANAGTNGNAGAISGAQGGTAAHAAPSSSQPTQAKNAARSGRTLAVTGTSTMSLMIAASAAAAMTGILALAWRKDSRSLD